MERPPPITVERLSPTTRGDYLAFFDHEHGPAFADNPEWARCYCQFYRTPRALDWQAFTASENRIAAAAAIDCGEAEGYLAKAEGTIPPDAREASLPPEGGRALGTALRAAIPPDAREASLPPEGGRALGTAPEARSSVVGWMHAAPRHKLPHCFERMKIAPLPVDVAPHEAAVIVCFVIAPAWRRRGVASALLDVALADFAARGIAVVDAFPFKSGASTDATDHYHGPASLFASRGFVPVADHPDLTVVRKQLVPGVGTSSSP
jgi:ribosomal protein S18 acetylase RimI-like enzyme